MKYLSWKYSPCRELFKNLKEEISPGGVGVRVLCPTRWTVKAESINSIISNFNVMQDLWNQVIAIVHDTKVIVCIRGVAAQMQTFEFFFGILLLGEVLFRHSDDLSRTLQRTDYSAVEGQLAADKNIVTLQKIWNEEF